MRDFVKNRSRKIKKRDFRRNVSDVYGEGAFKLCRNWFAKVHLEDLKSFLELFFVDKGKNKLDNILKLLFLTKNSPFIRNYFFANLTVSRHLYGSIKCEFTSYKEATSDSRNCWKNNYFLKFWNVNFSSFTKNKVKLNVFVILTEVKNSW